jgi:hypothetical protein
MLLCFALPGAAELYKWVDENGVTHYGDRIPPEYAKQQREVLSPQGDTIKVLEHEKTAAESAEDTRKEELKRQDEEQVKRDRILLDLYGSEADLAKSRDEQLANLDGNIRITEIAMQGTERDLKSRQDRAAQLKQQGKPVPPDLERQIKDLDSRLNADRQALTKRREERQALASRFDRDLLRWRQLRGVAAPAPGSAPDQGANPGVGK